MKKVAVLIEDYYEVLEAWYPYLRLREAGFETTFVGPGSNKEYHSKEGYPAPEEAKVRDVTEKQFDAVVIPGGIAPDRMRRHPGMNQFVRKMADSGKLIAAICHAGSVLVSAGVLHDRKVTSFFSIKDDVVNAGAQFEDKEVVVDGNLITSRNPNDLPAFCREIINWLESH